MFLTHFPFHKGFIHKLILMRAFLITQFDKRKLLLHTNILRKKEDVLSSYKQRNFRCISGFPVFNLPGWLESLFKIILLEGFSGNGKTFFSFPFTVVRQDEGFLNISCNDILPVMIISKCFMRKRPMHAYSKLSRHIQYFKISSMLVRNV